MQRLVMTYDEAKRQGYCLKTGPKGVDDWDAPKVCALDRRHRGSHAYRGIYDATQQSVTLEVNPF